MYQCMTNMTPDTIVTLADAARTFAGDDLTRNQLKVIRARLRRHKVTQTVSVSDMGHYFVTAGTSTHLAIGERAF